MRIFRVIFIAVFVCLCLYLLKTFAFRPSSTRATSFTKTTCESLGLQSANAAIGGDKFTQDFEKLVCSYHENSPQKSGDGKCYKQTLACSNGNYPVGSSTYCISPDCFVCVNQEVNSSECDAPVTSTPVPPLPSTQTYCASKDADWTKKAYRCDLGNGKKYLYNSCTADQYRCMCDDAGKYRYPTLQKDLTCVVPPSPPPTPVKTPAYIACTSRDNDWATTAFKCDLGNGKKYLYNSCTPDQYKCECDSSGKYSYPTLQKDPSCADTTPKQSCDVKAILAPLIKAYDLQDYQTIYFEMQKDFLSPNTQTSAGQVTCYMAGAQLSGSSCVNLPLDDAFSNGCYCKSAIAYALSQQIDNPYEQVTILDVCKNALNEVFKYR